VSEDRPIDLNAAVEPYVGVAVVLLGAGILVLLLIALVQARRIRGLRRRLDGLTRGADGRSLEAVLEAHLDKVFGVAREVDELSARSAMLESTGRRAVQRVGLVRFNPFEETGGNQSFALAMTDAHGDGVVISSLHARAGTRLYAKAVVAGRSDAALSAEEAEALRLALASTSSRAAAGAAEQAGASV
jgi:Protein of unknown function (DUF4446)